MADIQKLKQLSIEELLQELRTREAKMEPREDLREFDNATIVKLLKEDQKVIYGTDDRVDVFQLPAGGNLDDVDSVVALFRAENVTDNGNGIKITPSNNPSERARAPQFNC